MAVVCFLFAEEGAQDNPFEASVEGLGMRIGKTAEAVQQEPHVSQPAQEPVVPPADHQPAQEQMIAPDEAKFDGMSGLDLLRLMSQKGHDAQGMFRGLLFYLLLRTGEAELPGWQIRFATRCLDAFKVRSDFDGPIDEAHDWRLVRAMRQLLTYLSRTLPIHLPKKGQKPSRYWREAYYLASGVPAEDRAAFEDFVLEFAKQVKIVVDVMGIQQKPRRTYRKPKASQKSPVLEVAEPTFTFKGGDFPTLSLGAGMPAA